MVPSVLGVLVNNLRRGSIADSASTAADLIVVSRPTVCAWRRVVLWLDRFTCAVRVGAVAYIVPSTDGSFIENQDRAREEFVTLLKVRPRPSYLREVLARLAVPF